MTDELPILGWTDPQQPDRVADGRQHQHRPGFQLNTRSSRRSRPASSSSPPGKTRQPPPSCCLAAATCQPDPIPDQSHDRPIVSAEHRHRAPERLLVHQPGQFTPFERPRLHEHPHRKPGAGRPGRHDHPGARQHGQFHVSGPDICSAGASRRPLRSRSLPTGPFCYNGNQASINSNIGSGLVAPNNVSGVTAFGAISTPVGSDVDPALTLANEPLRSQQWPRSLARIDSGDRQQRHPRDGNGRLVARPDGRRRPAAHRKRLSAGHGDGRHRLRRRRRTRCKSRRRPERSPSPMSTAAKLPPTWASPARGGIDHRQQPQSPTDARNAPLRAQRRSRGRHDRTGSSSTTGRPRPRSTSPPTPPSRISSTR